jgi:hypothetical protein
LLQNHRSSRGYLCQQLLRRCAAVLLTDCSTGWLLQGWQAVVGLHCVCDLLQLLCIWCDGG